MKGEHQARLSSLFRNLEELCPNLWIALRFAVTLTVAASAKMILSKWKPFKSSLRSSMSEEGIVL